jgi:hypothetical protein
MSYGFNAYILKARIPSESVFREWLQRAGGRVVIPEPGDLVTASGFLPVVLDGTPTGFEVYSSEITEPQREDHRNSLARAGEGPDRFLEILTACDLDVGFTCKTSDPHEVTAARIVATTLAEGAGGWFSDPQTAENIRYTRRKHIAPRSQRRIAPVSDSGGARDLMAEQLDELEALLRDGIKLSGQTSLGRRLPLREALASLATARDGQGEREAEESR